MSSERRLLTYDVNHIEPSKVTMIHRNSSVVFDLINKTTTPASYAVVPGIHSFTFLVEFTSGNLDLVEDVVLNVFTNAGRVEREGRVHDYV